MKFEIDIRKHPGLDRLQLHQRDENGKISGMRPLEDLQPEAESLRDTEFYLATARTEPLGNKTHDGTHARCVYTVGSPLFPVGNDAASKMALRSLFYRLGEAIAQKEFTDGTPWLNSSAPAERGQKKPTLAMDPENSEYRK